MAIPKRPIDHCFWVLPGKFLAGEYPRTREHGPSVEKVNALIEAGIKVFIDLTHPKDKLLKYDHLLGEGVEYINIPIVDVSVPRSPRIMRDILDAIDYNLKSGRKVYVHCWGGVGRTGTVVGCWLARHGAGGMTAFKHLQLLWEKNPKSAYRNCPDTLRQKQYIIDWEEPELRDIKKFNGSMIGLAIGDAMGAAVEFMQPGTFPPVKDITGGGPFNLKAGEWTDDTSMALCMAASLIERGVFDADDQMKKYVAWWQSGYMSSNGRCFDIGGTTRKALASYMKIGRPYAGEVGEYMSGNGSLMRLAPVALFHANDPIDKALEACANSSRTTHGSEPCIDACRYYGGLIIGAVNGASKDELLSPRYRPGRRWEDGELNTLVEHVADGSFKIKDPPEIRGTGYVIDALEAALWAFHNGKDFRDGMLLAVNLGEDADTTGAIYGQLAGAYYGLKGIPPKWRAKIKYREKIAKISHDLFYARGNR